MRKLFKLAFAAVLGLLLHGQANAASGIVTLVMPPGGSSTSADPRPCFFFIVNGTWFAIPYAAVGASSQIAVVMEARLSQISIGFTAEPGISACSNIAIAEDIQY